MPAPSFFNTYYIARLCNHIVEGRTFGYSANTLKNCFIENALLVPEWITNLISSNPRTRLSSQYGNLVEAIPNINDFIDTCDSCLAISMDRWHVEIAGQPSRICAACYGATNWFEWSDGIFRAEAEPCIDAYGANSRENLCRKIDWRVKDLLGLEIEVFIPGTIKEVVEIAREAKNQGLCFAERDGSLSRSNGVEFIFAPISFAKMDEECDLYKVTQFLLKKGVLGWTASNTRNRYISGGGYGMHISLNSKYMSQLHSSKFCYFVNSNRKLCELVAGRNPNDYIRYHNWEIGDYSLRKRDQLDKYMAASRRNRDRIEVRIFRSALNWDRIKRNCELVDSIRCFTQNCGVQDLDKDHYFDFLDMPENRAQYSLLREFFGLKEVIMNNSKTKLSIKKDIAFSMETLPYKKVGR